MNAKKAIRTQYGKWPLFTLNLGARPNKGRNRECQIVSQRVASDPSFSVKGVFSFSPKRLDQVERPNAVLKRIARVRFLVRGTGEERGRVIRRPDECFKFIARQIADKISRLYKIRLEIRSTGVNKYEAGDTLLVLKGRQKHGFRGDGCVEQIRGMKIPGSEAICAIGEEAVTCIEEDESIAGTQLPDHVRELILEH
jgi:hypothetical protein